YVSLNSTLAINTTVTAIPANQANLTIQWSQASGPGTTTFTNPTSANTGASFSTPGSYDLRITANDGVESSTADVMVNVVGSSVVAGPSDNMVLRLPFDETSGNTANDASGVTPPNNGGLMANPTTNAVASWYSGGKINGCLS